MICGDDPDALALHHLCVREVRSSVLIQDATRIAMALLVRFLPHH